MLNGIALIATISGVQDLLLTNTAVILWGESQIAHIISLKDFRHRNMQEISCSDPQPSTQDILVTCQSEGVLKIFAVENGQLVYQDETKILNSEAADLYQLTGKILVKKAEGFKFVGIPEEVLPPDVPEDSQVWLEMMQYGQTAIIFVASCSGMSCTGDSIYYDLVEERALSIEEGLPLYHSYPSNERICFFPAREYQSLGHCNENVPEDEKFQSYGPCQLLGFSEGSFHTFCETKNKPVKISFDFDGVINETPLVGWVKKNSYRVEFDAKREVLQFTWEDRESSSFSTSYFDLKSQEFYHSDHWLNCDLSTRDLWCRQDGYLVRLDGGKLKREFYNQQTNSMRDISDGGPSIRIDENGLDSLSRQVLSSVLSRRRTPAKARSSQEAFSGELLWVEKGISLNLGSVHYHLTEK